MATNINEIMEALGQAAEITRQNSIGTAALMKKLTFQERALTNLSETVSHIDDKVTFLSDEVQNLKMNEEITTAQNATVLSSARKRIFEILGDDPYEQQKYFRTFIAHLYRDAKECAGLGSTISRTKKGDFQRCLDYIEAWMPKIGVPALKSYVDKQAEAKVKAKKNGYTN